GSIVGPPSSKTSTKTRYETRGRGTAGSPKTTHEEEEQQHSGTPPAPPREEEEEEACNVRIWAGWRGLRDSLAAACVRRLATWLPTLASNVASLLRRRLGCARSLKSINSPNRPCTKSWWRLRCFRRPG